MNRNQWWYAFLGVRALFANGTSLMCPKPKPG